MDQTNIDVELSSRRYKTNIVSLPDKYVNSIYNLRPVEFNYKFDHDIMNKKSVGLIAEEVDEHIPEVVIRNIIDNTIIEGVEYENLVAPLIKIAQQHQKEIQELRSYIDDHVRLKNRRVSFDNIPAQIFNEDDMVLRSSD